MSDRSRFSDEEWQILRDAPHLAAMAVASSGSSGFFGTLKEAVSASSAVLDGMKSDNPLISSLNAKQEIKISQAALQDRLKAMREGIEDRAELRQKAATLALEEVKAAMEILHAKGDASDLDAYRAFVQSTGQRVAEAAKEGAFLGIGGERVSEAEVEMLNQLEDVLNARA